MPAHHHVDLVTAVPTPFLPDEALDTSGLKTLFSELAARDIDAAFVAGTTGEFTALDDHERLSVIEAGLNAFGPQRTYAHIGAATARQAIALTKAACTLGARKLSAVTPYYFPAPVPAVIDYYERVVEAADGAEVYAYLFAARTTTIVPHNLLPKLAEVGVSGAKISGESDESVAQLLAHSPDNFTVFSGNDISFANLIEAGGAGIVSGVSSVFPEPFIGLRGALRSGDADAASKWQEHIVRTVALVKGGSLAHLKAGLELRGLPGGAVRSGVETISDSDREALASEVRKWASITFPPNVSVLPG